MTNDIESVPSIVACAAGRTRGGELNFTFPEVLDAIKMCTSNNIAVLGIDVFEVRAEGYLTKRQPRIHMIERHNRDWPISFKSRVGRVTSDLAMSRPSVS
jgi:hypothetical protein